MRLALPTWKSLINQNHIFMKAINYIFLGLFSILACNQVAAQTDRDIFWIHGLGSNSIHWSNYERLFQNERRVVRSNTAQSYTTTQGVSTMANDVRNRTFRTGQNIAIAHSMGGVAARDIDSRVAPGHFGGIITVGSPLSGARIINAYKSGEVQSATSQGVRQLTKGPIRTLGGLFNNQPIFVKLGINYYATTLTDRLFTEALLKMVPVNVINSQSGTDLAERSPYINSVLNSSTPTPKVSIYGSEDYPVHFRVASSAITNGVSDIELAPIVNDFASAYYGLAIYYYTVGAIEFINGIYSWNFYQIGNGLRLIYTGYGWYEGYVYIVQDSHKDWINLIGAKRTESTTECYTGYVCGINPVCQGIRRIVEDVVYYEQTGECNTCWAQQICRQVSRTIIEPSDGLVHASSAQGLAPLGSTSGWNAVSIKAESVNHAEMGTRTERYLRDIFDASNSAVGVNRYFRTLRR